MVHISYCIFQKYFEASFLKMMNNFLVCVICVNNSLKYFLPDNVKTRVYYTGQKLCAKFLIKNKTSKFEWMLNNIRKKRSFQPQFEPQFFLEVSALTDVRHCPKLQYCAISKKTNDTTLKKWQKP